MNRFLLTKSVSLIQGYSGMRREVVHYKHLVTKRHAQQRKKRKRYIVNMQPPTPLKKEYVWVKTEFKILVQTKRNWGWKEIK